MIIRKGEIEDLEQIKSILEQTSNIHYENRKDIFKKKGKEEIKSLAKEGIESNEKIVLVAEDNTKIKGILIYKIKKVKDNIHLKDSRNIWIDEICVDEKYRSQGIGKMLMDEIKKIARETGCQRIELNCWEFNERARKFYKENGLAIQRRIMEIDV